MSWMATKVAKIAAEDHLAFDADVPEAHAEGDGGADADDDQRRRLDQDRRRFSRIGEDLDDELVEKAAGSTPAAISSAADIARPATTPPASTSA